MKQQNGTHQPRNTNFWLEYVISANGSLVVCGGGLDSCDPLMKGIVTYGYPV